MKVYKCFKFKTIFFNQQRSYTTTLINTLLVNQTKIIVKQGNIVQEKVDAIVNAANSNLKHGGGVAYSILKAGGEVINNQSKEYISKYGFLKTADVAITEAGRLEAKIIIHTVGPIFNGIANDLTQADQLANATSNCLKALEQYNLKTISIPAISSGIFGFPKDLCAKIMLKAAIGFIKNKRTTIIEEIRFVIIDKETFLNFYQELINIKEKEI
eukprot:TRINITY_DN1080_c0_g1_i1.p1 TRINITY_DN1080_c0_g1~~TRINITY_DN1080_c0_g1_i1.p1  ORF type:complete len:214 (+),score=79.48 TRINITY_DN1080_c0_g1_i1:67-708(+)